MLQEHQGALQTESIEDAAPGDGHDVDINNESNPESKSTCSEEDLSSISDDAVLRLIATAAPKSRKQIGHLENAVQERIKENNKTIEALLEIGKLFSDFMIFAHSGRYHVSTLILCLFSFLSLSCGIAVNGRGDMEDLPGMNGVCDDSSTRLSVPAYRHFNTGVVTNVPQEPSLVNEVQGIDAVFLARHSRDPHLCESPQANVENALLLEAGPSGPNMVSIIILIGE